MASIVVVGGGVAGLTCAWRLKRAGHDVEVIEREADAGGRMRSETHGDFTVERGAHSVTAGDVNLRGVAKSLGLERRLRANSDGGDAVCRGSEFESVDLAKPLRLLGSRALSARAKARLARLPVEVIRRAALLDPAHPERAGSLDDRSLAAGLCPIIGEEAFRCVIAPLVAAIFGDAGAQMSFAAALLALRSGALQRRPLGFVGGNGVLTQTLARELPVLRGCAVTAIETETDGARIRFTRLGRESRVYADAVVVAIPGDQVAALCPKLRPAERGFFESVRYSREIAVHLLCERAPRAGAFGRIAFPVRERFDTSGITITGSARGLAPVGGAVVSATLTGSACEALWDADDAAIGARIGDQLAATSIGRMDIDATVVHRWPTARPYFAPGQIERYAAFLRRVERSPRIAFAGDYLLGQRLEAAVTSGLRAAIEISRF